MKRVKGETRKNQMAATREAAKGKNRNRSNSLKPSWAEQLAEHMAEEYGCIEASFVYRKSVSACWPVAGRLGSAGMTERSNKIGRGILAERSAPILKAVERLLRHQTEFHGRPTASGLVNQLFSCPSSQHPLRASHLYDSFFAQALLYCESAWPSVTFCLQ
jgi:hypothetical protein